MTASSRGEAGGQHIHWGAIAHARWGKVSSTSETPTDADHDSSLDVSFMYCASTEEGMVIRLGGATASSLASRDALKSQPRESEPCESGVL